MFPSSVTAARHHHTSFQPSSSSSSSSSDPFRRKPLSSFFVLRPPPRKPRRHGTLRASASLLRAPRLRRNALREKILSKNDPQVLQPHEAPDNPDRSGPDRPDRVEIPEIRTGSTTSDSALRSKLDNWVEQYREDNALWGVGTGPIFVVSRDPDGNVVKVSVDEQEIVRRNMIGGEERGILAKMERAKEIAEEIRVSGTHVIPENSSVVRFVEDGREVEVSPVDLIREVVLRGKMSRKLPLSLAALALCGYVVFRAVWWLWSAGEAEELTSLEKEMLRRKLKARRRSGLVVEGNVEVVQDDDDDAVSPVGELKRPELDMEKLKKDIAGAKVVREVSTKASLPGRVPGCGDGFEDKVKAIREMAKRARESERQVVRGGTKGMQDNIQVENSDLQPVTLSSSMEVPEDVEERKESTVGVAETFTENGSDASEKERITMDAPSSREEARDGVACDLSLSIKNSAAATKPKIIRSVKEARDYLSRKYKRTEEGSFSPWHLVSGGKQVGPALHGLADSLCNSSAEESENIKRVNEAVVKQNFDLIENMEVKKMDSESKAERSRETNSGVILPNTLEESTKSGNPSRIGHPDITDMECTEFQVLSSVAESNDSQNMEERISSKKSSTSVYGSSSSRDVQSATLDVNSELPENRNSGEMIKLEHNLPSMVDSAAYMAPEKYDIGSSSSHFPPDSDGILEKSAKMSSLKVENGGGNLLLNRHNSASFERTGDLPDSQNHLLESKQVGKNNWIKENFHEFEPIVKKIREGFRENYMMAKQKARERDMMNVGLHELDLEDDEMEWVKDEKLKEIFFKVRENELAGKDPFYSMSADYKQAFFKFLEKKAEKFNKKLSALHVWLHSRIENIDYGADGISLYDPPEKVFPRWKGPAFDKYPAFLKNSERKQQDSSASNEEKICASSEDREKVSNSPGSALSTVSVDVNSKRPQNRANSTPRTIIECSDGSSRAGKKGGKEQWEHTKKWSRGFLEIYNAETDPEVKSAMRDMGKDLDRWITEKEIEEVGKLMSGLPEKQRKYIENKVDKIKREMERYGTQAVVSKYREYSEEREDYLWWLDLKLVLCIELYTIENGSQKVGFYSLEMAPDLELHPKQLHVIAFEDPGDSKNFCYIMQTHLEMLGLGRAFVVPRPPKDAFREAKANGFHVTVIRKGELKLNIDQTLEEVEEEIVEIGSRIYHDRIIRERSVDIGALLTGVIASESSKK